MVLDIFKSIGEVAQGIPEALGRFSIGATYPGGIDAYRVDQRAKRLANQLNTMKVEQKQDMANAVKQIRSASPEQRPAMIKDFQARFDPTSLYMDAGEKQKAVQQRIENRRKFRESLPQNDPINLKYKRAQARQYGYGQRPLESFQQTPTVKRTQAKALDQGWQKYSQNHPGKTKYDYLQTPEAQNIAEIGSTTLESTLNLNPATPSERGELSELKSSEDILDKMFALRKNLIGGPGMEWLTDKTGAVGLTSEDRETLKALTNSYKNAIIKQITGAQMSIYEAARIMKEVPTENDPFTRYEAKYKAAKQTLKNERKRLTQAITSSGLKAPSFTELNKNATREDMEYILSQLDQTNPEHMKMAEQIYQLFVERGYE